MELPSFKNLHVYLQRLVEKKLWARVLVAMVLGVVAGILMGPTTGWVPPNVTESLGSWLALPGTLFLKLVQMIMIPLIFASIIMGIAASESMEQLRKFGLRLILYFLTTTTVAISIAIAVVYLIKPGDYFPSMAEQKPTQDAPDAELPEIAEIPSYITNLLPDNPLTSMVSGEMLSIVIFTIIIGVALTALSKKMSEPILRLLASVQEVCMTIVKWAMRLVPYAVFGIMAQVSSSFGVSSLTGMGVYVVTVLVGLLILLLLYLIMAAVIGGRRPGEFLRAIRDVQLLAFSTTSSAAVMPLSIKTAEDKLHVRQSVSSFLIPIGATINMDGTALYQCVSAVFIAQVYGIELGMVSLLLMMVTIVAASVGTPAIPGGGVIILSAILAGIGIPTEGIVMIIGVERILGMFRTAINVTGDMTACVVFDKWYRPDIAVDEAVET